MISFGFGGLTAGFLFPADSFAATFTVTTASDANCADFNCDLQSALTTAQSNGEADTINIAAGTYTTSGTNFLYTGASTENFALTLDGAGAGMTLLDGGNSTRVLLIDNSVVSPDTIADIIIRDLTIQNGSTTVDGSDAGLIAATNFAEGASDITIENCEFSGNTTNFSAGAAAAGAGVLTFSGDMTLTNNTFTNNSATADTTPSSFTPARGGGAVIRAFGGVVTLMNNTFDTNSASADFAASGGAEVLVSSPGTATLTNNIFNNNNATGSSSGAAAGGLSIQADPDVTLTNNTFTNNSAITSSGDGLGGGAFVFAPTTTLTNNTFTLNSTSGTGEFANGDGGGLYARSFDDTHTTNIYNNIAFNNTATGDGDDIFVSDDEDNNNTGSTVNLFNNDFSDFFSACDADNVDPCTPNINGVTPTNTNINADPLFVDAPNGDIHIQSGSPCRDAGTALAPSLPLTDFEGYQGFLAWRQTSVLMKIHHP